MQKSLHFRAETVALAQPIKLLALDVDGVLSNGKLYFGNDGEELKTFDIQDGLGIKLLQQAGIEVAIITGRQSNIVSRRMNDLGITTVVQGREDKITALKEIASNKNIALKDIAYMGDDLPDLAAIQAAGLGMTVANANYFVLQYADWVSSRDGGNGAVREACELILFAQNQLDAAQQRFLLNS